MMSPCLSKSGGDGMTDRLLNLIIDAKKAEPDDNESFSEWLAEYLVKHGVIVPPCKMGTKLYRVWAYKTSRQRPHVRTIKLTYKTLEGVIADFGKSVFLSRKEAERAAYEKQQAEMQ